MLERVPAPHALDEGVAQLGICSCSPLPPGLAVRRAHCHGARHPIRRQNQAFSAFHIPYLLVTFHPAVFATSFAFASTRSARFSVFHSLALIFGRFSPFHFRYFDRRGRTCFG